MAEKLCGDGIGNSGGQPYDAGSDGVKPNAVFVSSPGEPRTLLPSTDPGGQKNRKNTSFQITSVTVQGSRLSNDGGDESADDLDESHTEDFSSEILDTSKATDMDNDQLSEDNANADDSPSLSHPVSGFMVRSDSGLPLTVGVSASFTSVGITPMTPAVVSSGGALTLVTSTSSTQALSTQVPINPLPDHWQRRFKVVKIVSSEPFRRGRWLCMDFVDPPAMPQELKTETLEQVSVEASSSTNSSSPAPSDIPSVNREAVAHVYEIPVGQTCSVASDNQQITQSVYGIILPVSNSQGPQITMLQTVGLSPLLREQSQQQSFSTQPPTATSNSQTASNQQSIPVAPQQQGVNQQSLSTQSTIVPAESSQQPPPSGQTQDSSYVPSQSVAASGATSESAELSQQPLSEGLPESLATKSTTEEDSESASAGSTVAIDNKIEQAMDLVKSHLMFAVREEVDVLKERITELLDRISQLEYENGILRASATPETLSRLNQQPQQPLAAPPPPQQQQQQQQQAPPSTQQQAQPPQPQTTNRSS